MTAETITSAPRGQIQQSYRLAGPVLGFGILLLGVLFYAEAAAAVHVWMQSTAYNHCFLVLPIVAYLIWDRRDRLALTAPTPNAWFAIAAIPVAMVWLLAERLGIMEGRQLMAMTLVEILLLSVLGWRFCYQFAGPLLYLYFLVPFGAFITPTLQGFTTSFVVHGLDLLSIPNFADGYSIAIPEGSFLVAEACAGLRFLIASIAFGCLYALLMYRSPLRRGLFILASIIVPIIANGFRALGIVVLGHIIGDAQAAVADHLIYGWLFFSVVILLQILLGLPFRQDHRAAAAPIPDTNAPLRPIQATGQSSAGPGTHSSRGVRRRSQSGQRRLLDSVHAVWMALCEEAARAPSRAVTLRGLATAAAVSVALAAIGPAAASAFNRGSGAGLPATLRPITFTGACTTTSDHPIEQHDGVGRLWVQHLKCGDIAFTLRLEVLPPRATPDLILDELRTLSGEAGAEVTTTTYIATPSGLRTWRILDLRDPASTIASSLWIDGHPADTAFDMRMHRAWASMVGSRYAPVMISLTPELDWSKPSVALRYRAHDLISLFVRTYQSLPDQIVRLSYAAAH